MIAAPISRRAFLAQATMALAAGLALPHIASAAGAPEPAKSGPWQIGCYTRPWAGQDWRVAFDAVADAATVDGLVVGMSVKDFLPPKSVDVTPGTGKVNFAAVLARLKAGGFTQGALVVETLAPGDAAKTLAEAKNARRFLEQLIG